MLSGQTGLELSEEYINFAKKVSENFDNYSIAIATDLQKRIEAWLKEARKTSLLILAHLVDCPNPDTHTEDMQQIAELGLSLSVALSTLQIFAIKAQRNQIKKSNLN